MKFLLVARISILKDKIELQDTDHEEQTGVESDDDSSVGDEDEEDHNITAGDVVSGMCGRMWYPAKVYSLTDVSENMHNLSRNNQQKLILKWYSGNNYSLVKESNVECLAENKVDAQRASRSSNLQILYNTALADLFE